MSERHRVLHIITVFPVSSGAAENTKLTLNGLDRRRYHAMVAFLPGSTMERELAPDVERIPLRWLRREPSLFDLAAFFELVRVIRKTKASIVHTHNAKDGILGRFAAAFCGVPVVHTIHNVSFEASRFAAMNAVYAALERVAAPLTARLLAVSGENSARYIARGIGQPSQYRTVYSGLALEKYGRDARSPSEIRRDAGLPEAKGPWVGWFGRFNDQKDPLTFVRAAAIVRDAVPGVRFVVCGDAPIGLSLEADSRDLCQKLGLTDCMHFLGFRRDLPSLIQGVDLVMHSSRYEGMGRVICESLASGKPVVGTAVDGVVEVVHSGERGGVLAQAGDARGLADGAIALLRDPARASALAAKGKAWVEANLSSVSMVAAIDEVYEAALAQLRPH